MKRSHENGAILSGLVLSFLLLLLYSLFLYLNFSFSFYSPAVLAGAFCLLCIRWWLEAVVKGWSIHRWLVKQKASIHWMVSFQLALIATLHSISTSPRSHLHARWRQFHQSGFQADFPHLDAPQSSCRPWVKSIFILVVIAGALYSGNSIGLIASLVLLLLLVICHLPVLFNAGPADDLPDSPEKGRGAEWMAISGFVILDLLILSLIVPWSPAGFIMVGLIHFAATIIFGAAAAGIREWSLIGVFALAPVLGFGATIPEDFLWAMSFISFSNFLMVLLMWTKCRKFLGRRTQSSSFEWPSQPTLSIVIPVFNEAEVIGETLSRIQDAATLPHEIICVDGGSSDTTANIVQKHGCRLVSSPGGRGTQMNRGWQLAQGDIILFCHADTWLSPGFDLALTRCLHDPCVGWGGFWKSFQSPSPLMAGSRFRCWTRWLISHRVFGDQCLFFRRSVLDAIGGIPEVPLMEEFVLARSLRQSHPGSIALADSTVLTSSRKFRKLGALRTYWRMGLVTALYFLGVPLDKINDIYRKP